MNTITIGANTALTPVYLFFDVEATGLIKRGPGVELGDSDQPRIMQLAGILTDEEGKEIEHLNLFIKPDGWEVPYEITQLTGITTEFLEQHGIPMIEALAQFNALKARCTHRVGHNVSYDKQMLAREALACNVDHDSEGKASFCTMHGTSKIVAQGRGIKYKPAKLGEAYEYFMGKPHANAHDALGDAHACMEVFFALKKWQAASTGAA